MINRTLLIDAAAAGLAAILLIVIAPGLAVAGLVSLLVLVLIAVTYLIERWRGRRRRRSRPPRRRRGSGLSGL